MQTLQDPEVSLLAIEPIPSEGMIARFKLKLLIINPNNIDLALNGVHFRLDVAGSKILSGVSNNMPILKAYGESTVEVDSSMSVLGLMHLLAKLADNKNQMIKYQLKTTIDPKRFMSFKVEHSGELTSDLLLGLNQVR